MEQDGDKYRTFDGLLKMDGATKASAWRTARPTNVGRSNERDGVAQATFEIEAAYEKQLKTEYHRTIEDTKKGAHYTQPMLAKTYATFAPGFVQPKLDGVRCILKNEGGFSREGEILPGAAHIRRAFDPLFKANPNIILDGELYNHDLKDDFNELISLIRKGSPSPERLAQIEAKVEYHVYDAPAASGGYRQRYTALQRLFSMNLPPFIRLVPAFEVTDAETFDQLHGELVEAGYEGTMWRCPDSPYEQGKRSKTLLKRKDFDDEEFEIVAIEQGEGNWAGAAKRVICWLPGADRTPGPSKDNTFEAGLRGSYAKNQQLLAEADQHKVATIRFFGFTPSAVPKPRFGVATKFHGAARTL
jgi:DNA ligase-1